MARREELVHARLACLSREEVQNCKLRELFAWIDEEIIDETACYCMHDQPTLL